MNMSSVFSILYRQYNKFIAIPLAQRKLRDIHIMNSIDSIKYIIDNRCSVSRFGDGEFDVMMGKNGNTFQKANSELADRLFRVLKSNGDSNHMIGIPYPIKGTRNLSKGAVDFWSFYVLRNVDFLTKNLTTSKIYLDTQLSRFYCIYEKSDHCDYQLKLLKQIWDKKDVLIIEGVQSRTGIGNDLYNNAKSIRRILGPATDAYSKYTQMLNTIIKNAQKDDLILLSYGMCATVLAYELSKLGYWAIDIGHLDIEYEWYLMGDKDRPAIKGKFTNEAVNGNKVEQCDDILYQSQIICDITKE